jgi:hypothetical protein
MTSEIDRQIIDKCRQVTVEKDNSKLLKLVEELTALFEQRDLLLKTQKQ